MLLPSTLALLLPLLALTTQASSSSTSPSSSSSSSSASSASSSSSTSASTSSLQSRQLSLSTSPSNCKTAFATSILSSKALLDCFKDLEKNGQASDMKDLAHEHASKFEDVYGALGKDAKFGCENVKRFDEFTSRDLVDCYGKMDKVVEDQEREEVLNDVKDQEDVEGKVLDSVVLEESLNEKDEALTDACNKALSGKTMNVDSAVDCLASVKDGKSFIDSITKKAGLKNIEDAKPTSDSPCVKIAEEFTPADLAACYNHLNGGKAAAPKVDDVCDQALAKEKMSASDLLGCLKGTKDTKSVFDQLSVKAKSAAIRDNAPKDICSVVTGDFNAAEILACFDSLKDEGHKGGDVSSAVSKLITGFAGTKGTASEKPSKVSEPSAKEKKDVCYKALYDKDLTYVEALGCLTAPASKYQKEFFTKLENHKLAKGTDTKKACKTLEKSFDFDTLAACYQNMHPAKIVPPKSSDDENAGENEDAPLPKKLKKGSGVTHDGDNKDKGKKKSDGTKTKTPAKKKVAPKTTVTAKPTETAKSNAAAAGGGQRKQVGMVTAAVVVGVAGMIIM
ncbi:hypothetical protein HDU97_003872 [Phlyctochytrium planicorne]|nr:hypothetical protein HDU97_003872 [Phlyctochytrium planicorne]